MNNDEREIFDEFDDLDVTSENTNINKEEKMDNNFNSENNFNIDEKNIDN